MRTTYDLTGGASADLAAYPKKSRRPFREAGSSHPLNRVLPLHRSTVMIVVVVVIVVTGTRVMRMMTHPVVVCPIAVAVPVAIAVPAETDHHAGANHAWLLVTLLGRVAVDHAVIDLRESGRTRQKRAACNQRGDDRT